MLVMMQILSMKFTCVQIDSGQTSSLGGLVGEQSEEGVVELTSTETTMHLASDDCCSVLPSDGMSITQLFPSNHHHDTSVVATATSSVTVSHSNSIMATSAATSQVTFADLVEDSKMHSKVRLLCLLEICRYRILLVWKSLIAYL